MIETLILLMVLMQFKHFIADYPLQLPIKYMYGKFKTENWVLPLAAHSGVHFAFTFVIAICLVSFKIALLCACIDFVIHFIMDRIKASPDLLGRYHALSKDQFKGLAESLALAKSGVAANITPELTKESERLVDEITGKFKSNTYFWYALGLDQMIHGLTDLLTVVIMVQYMNGWNLFN